MFRYLGHKSDDKVLAHGVPARDLTDDEVDAMPDEIASLIRADGLFHHTKDRVPAADAPKADAPKAADGGR